MKHGISLDERTLPACEAVERRLLLAANISTSGEYAGTFDGEGDRDDAVVVIDFDNVQGKSVVGKLDAGRLGEFNFTGRVTGRRVLLTLDNGSGDDEAARFVGSVSKDGERIKGRLVDGDGDDIVTGQTRLVDFGTGSDIVEGRGDEAIFDRGIAEENEGGVGRPGGSDDGDDDKPKKKKKRPVDEQPPLQGGNDDGNDDGNNGGNDGGDDDDEDDVIDDDPCLDGDLVA